MKAYIFRGITIISHRVYPTGVNYVIVATSEADAWKQFKKSFNAVVKEEWKVTELDTSKRSIIWL